MNELSGRGALVSGGARGSGLAIAEDLALHGASVVLIDSGVSIGGDPEAPQIALQAAAGIRGTAGVAGDVADPAATTAIPYASTLPFPHTDLVATFESAEFEMFCTVRP